MIQFLLQMERKDDGIVQVRVLDGAEEPHTLVWECTVAQEWGRDAQRAALKATMNYLHSFVDLTQGGKY